MRSSSKNRLTSAVVAFCLLLGLCAWPVAASARFSSAEPFQWLPGYGAGQDTMYQVSTVSPSLAYAVGYSSVTLQASVYKYDGTQWNKQSFHPASRLTCVSALADGKAWAAGDAGELAFFDGTSWSVVPSGTGSDLNSVCALDSSHVWVAGTNGTIMFYDGNAWSFQDSTVPVRLGSIFALDPQHVWVVGPEGLILFYDGSRWSQQQTGVGEQLNGVVALDDANAWACGESGRLLRLDSGGWHAVDSGTGVSLRGVSALDEDHVWVVGDTGTILFGNGIDWKVQRSGTTESLQGISALDTANAWAVGTTGTVLQGMSSGTPTSTTFYFAEGTSRPGFFPYLCIQVPGGTPAHVKMTFMRGAGGASAFEYDLQPVCRTTFDLKALLGEANDAAHDFSVKVESTVPIIAERPMYFSFSGWKGGHDVIGASHPAATFYFAEGTCRPGYASYLCIQNPGATASHVAVTYMLGNGTNTRRDLVVGPQSRSTITVNDVLGSGDDSAHDFSAKVETTDGTGIVAERPMYFSYRLGRPGYSWVGGHDVVGASAPARAFYFAEGSCRPGFEPYICIQNPGAVAANVRLTMMRGTGENKQVDIVVKERSRTTQSVVDLLGQADDAAHDFSLKVETTNGQRIIAERPMYFNYRGVWTGGHDVVGATRPAQYYYFAEGTTRPGFAPYICVQNPGDSEAVVELTYMLGDGTNKNQLVKVPARSRSTVAVLDFLGSKDDMSHDFSARLVADGRAEIICERPMYFAYRGTITGGHDVVGYSP
jgi:hypothetical protein